MNKPMTHSDGSLLYLPEVVQATPRLWSALDRENGSPTYGSFDREHWGWKFRDFPDERNRAAIRLYERLGYRIIGRDGAQFRMLWEL